VRLGHGISAAGAIIPVDSVETLIILGKFSFFHKLRSGSFRVPLKSLKQMREASGAVDAFDTKNLMSFGTSTQNP
jgi:hypothetical protein